MSTNQHPEVAPLPSHFFPAASEVPTLHITSTPSGPGIPGRRELKGWDDLDHWGRCNHGHWEAIQSQTKYAIDISEIDKLRLLAGEMLRLNVDLMVRYLEMARLMPTSPSIIAPADHCSPPHVVGKIDRI